MAKSKKILVQPTGAGKKIAEMVWTAVIGIAATGGASAAQRPSFDDDDLATRAAQEKSGVAGMMAGAGVEAATQVELIDGLPADIAQLIQAALDHSASLDQPAAVLVDGEASALPAWAAADGMAGGLPPAPLYVAAAEGGDPASDAGSTIDWASSMQFAQAGSSGATEGAAAAGGAAAAAEAAAPAAVGMDMGLLALVGVGAAVAGGGGGGGGSDAGPAMVAGIGGRAVDGYVAGAKVYLDSNGNGLWDTGDTMAGTTDAQGNFQVSGNFAVGAKVFVKGGVNNGIGDGNAMMVSLNVDLQGVVDADGQIVVSPLTTLLATSGLSEAALKTALGIPQGIDINSYDPVAALSGADSGTAEHVFAAAQQVMTLLQTAVASGVSFASATQALGNSLAAPGGNLATATQAIVTTISQVPGSDFADAAAQTQLLEAITNVNASIATAYSGLSEALGDPAAMAAALAVTSVAQTDFLDAVSSGVGIQQFTPDGGSGFDQLIANAENNIINDVQSLDATVLSDLLAAGVSFSGDTLNITFDDTGDTALLSSLLSTLGTQGVALGDISVDTSLGDFQTTVLDSFTAAGFDTTNVEVMVGDY